MLLYVVISLVVLLGFSTSDWLNVALRIRGSVKLQTKCGRQRYQAWGHCNNNL